MICLANFGFSVFLFRHYHPMYHCIVYIVVQCNNTCKYMLYYVLIRIVVSLEPDTIVLTSIFFFYDNSLCLQDEGK
jgi:hypothetical protein